MMNNYEFLSTLVLRIPRYTKEHIDRQQKEVLEDPVFRDAIFLASECIYDEMKKRDFDPDRFPGRLQQTLQKYHRRMCCRPTPFGGFSSLSVLEWGRNTSSSALEVCKSSFHTHIQKKFENPQSPPLYYLNPAIYRFGKNYRLCEGITKDDEGCRIYNLFEIEGRAIPAKLLRMSGKFKREDILELYTGYGLSDPQAESCLLDLADCQVILQADTSTWKEIEALPSISAVGKSSDLYAVTLNEVKGFLDPGIMEKLLEGIHCLNQLIPRDEESDLDKFKLRFTDLFDKREVPLLSALDPEAGIDYGQNASWMITNEPEFELKTSKRPPEWGKVQELLLRKWTEQHDLKTPVIRIEKEDLLILNKDEKPMLSQAVIFNMQDGQVCLHAAGGSSAAALIGRFTIFDDRISEIARRICLMEQEANPEVIFAEVIHDSEDKTDRLNNRTQFRDFVIPVLTDTPAESESRIELNDLYLSIKSDQLILRSKRLNKRVIPRLGTSYNYRRNPLSIYRLLCDLQNEGINPGASLSMPKLLPGLRFYPRVCYKDVILETASWYPDPQVFSDLYKKPADFYNDFLNYADKLGLPETFIYEQNDQRLLIRKNNEKDIRLLIDTVKNQEIIVLREFLSEEKALVKDEKDGTYVHELVAFLVNKESVYAGLPISPRNNKQEISRFHPLKDWHFLKVYMHPAIMDDFLTNILEGFIKNCYKAGLLESWYFIRYKDNDDHLRIRLKIDAAEDLLLKRLQIFIAGLKKIPASGMSSYVPMKGSWKGIRQLVLIMQKLSFPLAAIWHFSRLAAHPEQIKQMANRSLMPGSALKMNY